MSTVSRLELRHVHPGVRPQDDLHRHVSGTWIEAHELPEDRSYDGVAAELTERTAERVHEVIRAAPTGSRTEVLYRSFLDEEEIERRGLAALDPDLEVLEAAVGKEDLARASAALHRTGVDGFLAFFVDNDPRDSSRRSFFLCQGGLSLPTRSYYSDSVHEELRLRFAEHVAAMLDLAGLPGRGGTTAAEAAATVLAMETRLAAAHWDAVEARDVERMYNPVDVAGLRALAPGFPWTAWLEGAAPGHGPAAFDRVIVRQPSFVTALGRLWEEWSEEQIRLWLSWRTVSRRAPFLPRSFVEENFRFYGTALAGTVRPRERWKRAEFLVTRVLGDDVARGYVARWFPAEHRQRVEQLVGHLLDAYRERIAGLDWMSEATRARALEKLAAFTVKTGCPRAWRDYSSLVLDPADLLGNVRSGLALEHDRVLATMGTAGDGDEWLLQPHWVNAYFHPVLNEVVFPAAILQPPYFDPEADDAVNYGAIGAVIGHEIGHGFDDQGSRYDGRGHLENWWTDEDRAEFARRTAALVAQYDGFTPRGLDPAEHHVSGAFTLGENIGDLGGLEIALAAYRRSLAERGLDLAGAPVLDGLTGAQRFFCAHAALRRSTARAQERINRLATDPHAPDEFRCNGVVRNMDAFHDTFGTRPGDGMWLPPEDRIHIW
ncbi:M13 family metallopeptidase [Kocuria sp. M1R5S2]|uniref:M13 family metallopeptidase n=1 Tax=Kocuria rhizosphaerae TaxID=3376285 RepID=UPI00379958E9